MKALDIADRSKIVNNEIRGRYIPQANYSIHSVVCIFLVALREFHQLICAKVTYSTNRLMAIELPKSTWASFEM